MSSTNRSKSRDSHIADYYITPINDVVNFLYEFIKIEPNYENLIVLAPCGGGDINHPMSYPEALRQMGYNKKVFTVDIREDSLADKKANYLTLELKKQPGVIISNPPFALALDFIQKGLKDVCDNGWVIFLLRLNFLESKERKAFFDQNMPEYIFVHHKRMSFTDKSGTDSIAYAHVVWRKGYSPEFAKLKII